MTLKIKDKKGKVSMVLTDEGNVEDVEKVEEVKKENTKKKPKKEKK